MSPERRRGGAVLSTVINVLTGIVLAILLLAILFVLLSANPRNGLVRSVNRFAVDLIGPFRDLFLPRNADLRAILNFGIPAVIYGIVGAALARVARRV